MFFYLSWVDARTKAEVIQTTNASLNDPTYNNGQGCQFPCQSSGKVASGGCCDTIYLPHVEHTNIYGLSQACTKTPNPYVSDLRQRNCGSYSLPNTPRFLLKFSNLTTHAELLPRV